MRYFFILLSVILSLTWVEAKDLQKFYKLYLSDSNGQILWQKLLSDHSKFGIKYTHSVAKSPVEDWFVIKNGQIYIDETIYHDFGAGLPFLENSGQTMSFKNGQVILEGLDTKLVTFDVRVGRIANHILLIPQDDLNSLEEIPLKNLAAPGSAITFTLKDPNNY